MGTLLAPSPAADGAADQANGHKTSDQKASRGSGAATIPPPPPCSLSARYDEPPPPPSPNAASIKRAVSALSGDAKTIETAVSISSMAGSKRRRVSMGGA